MALRSYSRILIGLAAGVLTVPVTQAQSSEAVDFQNNQIGMNSFVSGSKGTVYMIFQGNLYRNVTDEADSWDQIAKGVESVAVDPQDDNVLYAIDAQSHIIKSLDAGAKWISLDSAPSNAGPWFLYINPENTQEIFAGTANGLVKTSDGGFSWQDASLTGRISQFMVNPRSPSHYYALVGGTIYVSSDRGGTWKKSETGLPTEIVRGGGRTASKVTVKCSVLVFVNWDKPFLLAATATSGVYRSDDDGVSWKSSSAGIGPRDAITKAFVGSREIVLATNDSIYSSRDGASWKYLPVKSGRYHPQFFIGVLGYPRHDGLLLVFRFYEDSGDVLRIGYLDAKGVLVGLNYGVLPHSEVDNVWVGSMNGRPAIFSATANLYLSDQVQEWTRPTFISVSQGGGYSWELVGKTECGEQALVRGGLPTDMWIYGSPVCVRTTNDGGLNWTNASGVNFRYGNASMSRISLDPKNKNVWYYCVGVNEYYLYRYQYDPSTKQGQAVDLKVVANDVVVADDNDKELFTDSGRLTTNGGWTWTDKSAALVKYMPSGLWSSGIRLVYFRNGEIRAVIGSYDRMSNNSMVTVIKSADMGSTWQVASSLPDEQLMSERAFMSGGLMVFPNSNNPLNLFIATVSYSKGPYSYRATASKVFETKDGGETWQEVYSRDVTEKDGRQDIETIRGVGQMPTSTGRVLFVGGSHGLWRSEDEGETWKRVGGVQ
ncbi:MAG: hypothetical protein ABSF92_10655 [Candidatus Acidiferrales bacterium]|jgi:photosystem II stability/assembly factor-like uncharacterized protein